MFSKYAASLQEDTHAKVRFRHGCSPVNLLHIFRTPFPKNTYGWLLLKHLSHRTTLDDCSLNADIWKMKHGKWIFFNVERWMQYLLIGLKSQSAREHLDIQLLWASTRLLVTRVSLIYLADDFFFWFLV